MEVRKLRKWPISESISSASIHAIKTLMVNCDTPRQYLNFSGHIFDIRPYAALRDLQLLPFDYLLELSVLLLHPAYKLYLENLHLVSDVISLHYNFIIN